MMSINAKLTMRAMVSRAALVAGAIAFSPVGGAAHAQAAGEEEAARPISSGIEDIVVTARKRVEDVQDVPLSVSAVSGASLERRGIASVKELAASVPSLSLIGQNSARSSIVQIRGIGSSGLNPGIEPDVGVYFDGSYQKSVAAVLQSNLLDIEAVEVLRGPQGTLYGRNTPVGAIIIRSRVPTTAPEAMLQVGGGNYDALYLQGYVGGGLGENLAARLSFFGSRFDGYDYNIATRSRVNGNKQYGGRLRVRWEPSDNFTGDLIAYYTRTRSECCVADNVLPFGFRGIATPGFLTAAQITIGRPYTNLVDKDHIVDSSENPLEFIKNFGVSFSGELAINDKLSLTSITAYTGTRVTTPRSSSLSQPITAITTGFTNPIDSYSQEFRLSSAADSPITFQVGTYLFQEKTAFDETRTTVNVNRVFPTGPQLTPGQSVNFVFDQKTFSASGYGQATWNVSEAFRLTGGARYSHDRKRGSVASVLSANATANFRASFSAYAVPRLRYSESKTTWLVSAQYDLTDHVMTYASASTGWKSGGFTGRPAPLNSPLEFGPENAKNYELGMKSTFFDRKALLNISLYKLKVSGFQDSILNPVTGVGFIVGNAGTVNAKGVEADFQLRPIPQLLIIGSATYLDSHFSNYSAAPCFTGAVANGSRPNTCNLNGATPAYSPKWRGSLGAEFTQPIREGLSAFIRGDASYSSTQNVYSALDPRSIQSGYTVYNGRLGLEGPDAKWRVSLWGKNLTNRVYYSSVAPVANAGFLSAGGTTGVNGPLLGWTGAPRTYGLEASMKF
jgi:iron complex outermembrane receptor protein